MLLGFGAATAIAVSSVGAAQPAGISGTVEFEGGGFIPEGEVEIYVEDLGGREDAQHRAAGTRLKSDGGSREIEFAFSPPAGSSAAPSVQIVARLERTDGWLLARGSAKLETNSPVQITLHVAMY